MDPGIANIIVAVIGGGSVIAAALISRTRPADSERKPGVFRTKVVPILGWTAKLLGAICVGILGANFAMYIYGIESGLVGFVGFILGGLPFMFAFDWMVRYFSSP